MGTLVHGPPASRRCTRATVRARPCAQSHAQHRVTQAKRSMRGGGFAPCAACRPRGCPSP
eukprot:2668966-Pleurochrysis_carterae.AAC.4